MSKNKILHIQHPARPIYERTGLVASTVSINRRFFIALVIQNRKALGFKQAYLVELPDNIYCVTSHKFVLDTEES